MVVLDLWLMLTLYQTSVDSRVRVIRTKKITFVRVIFEF